ncbi:hypothetical protein DFR24_4292 [Panacagrimonas perspica]|uniref:Metal-dependent hydrolase n=1 Tax=Panacagrimonas perspica TaxID=381431 RepID=A0A4R7NXF1_9GAMM|nr:metal-dependent hydrolase [Panacagrimonas perspica]TDU25847.1 hypothetical protein DFR24_4292 [Panacagrimonas perspica]THD02786.1 hypothetical protein B1810_12760 [Panacagrimonas perspica]
MRKLASHPMDDFPVRPLTFDLGSAEGEGVVWSRTCPEFAVFINALALHIPHFERYLIKAMRAAREHITDPKLRRDMTAIIGQEAHHAKNFLLFNAALARRYPKVGRHDAEAAKDFADRAEKDSLKQLVGFTAGYETFTFLAGIIILKNYERWFADSDPTLKAMWMWHQVEEIEHGAVAFDVYKQLYGQHEWYRKWTILHALTHIAVQTLKTYPHMAKVEGWLRNPFKGAAKLWFCVHMLLRLLHAALPVFRRNYDPRKHPIATTAQDPIQVAWRRFEAADGDVLKIDHERMAQMLGVAAKPA